MRAAVEEARERRQVRDALEVLRDACCHCLATGSPPNQTMIDLADAALFISGGSSADGAFLDRVRTVARECGYAVAVHGSEARDLDLVAAPWTPEAVSADHLVTRLCESVGLVEHEQAGVAPNPEMKPWGRIAWALAGCPSPHRYVDLSVAPRAGEPVPLVPPSNPTQGEEG